MISNSSTAKTVRQRSLSKTLVPNDIVSFWKMRTQITGGRWYHLFRAAPKTAVDSKGDFLIKLINPHLSSEQLQIAIDRLCREAITTDRIKHPNVIPLMDAELDQTPFFLIQPWVDGITHDTMMAREEAIGFNRLMWTFRQTAEGIRAAHDNGRVYLGLHPSHILLDRVGRTTLIGWSHSHGIDQTVRYKNDDLAIARYRAPETFADKYQAQVESDVYSLGVLIFQSLSKQQIATGVDIETIASSHSDENVLPLNSIQPHCPEDLAQLVHGMLSQQPGDRPLLADVIEELTTIEIEHLDDATPILQ